MYVSNNNPCPGNHGGNRAIDYRLVPMTVQNIDLLAFEYPGNFPNCSNIKYTEKLFSRNVTDFEPMLFKIIRGVTALFQINTYRPVFIRVQSENNRGT